MAWRVSSSLPCRAAIRWGMLMGVEVGWGLAPVVGFVAGILYPDVVSRLLIVFVLLALAQSRQEEERSATPPTAHSYFRPKIATTQLRTQHPTQQNGARHQLQTRPAQKGDDHDLNQLELPPARVHVRVHVCTRLRARCGWQEYLVGRLGRVFS